MSLRTLWGNDIAGTSVSAAHAAHIGCAQQLAARPRGVPKEDHARGVVDPVAAGAPAVRQGAGRHRQQARAAGLGDARQRRRLRSARLARAPDGAAAGAQAARNALISSWERYGSNGSDPPAENRANLPAPSSDVPDPYAAGDTGQSMRSAGAVHTLVRASNQRPTRPITEMQSGIPCTTQGRASPQHRNATWQRQSPES